MASASLANSSGWKFNGPTWTHSRAPLMSSPMWGTSGSTKRPDADEGEGVAVTLQVDGAGKSARVATKATTPTAVQVAWAEASALLSPAMNT